MRLLLTINVKSHILDLLGSGHSYTYCCRALTFAPAGSLVIIVISFRVSDVMTTAAAAGLARLSAAIIYLSLIQFQ